MTKSYATFVQDSNGLTIDAIRTYCPSALAETKGDGLSGKYLFIPTTRLIAAYADAGYAPTTVMSARSKTPEGLSAAKHLLTFRRIELLGSTAQEVHEVVLRNSHNGGGSYELMAGIFRMICANGMIAGNLGGSMKVRHVGNALDEIIAGSVRITEVSEQIMDAVAQMKSIELTVREQLAIAAAALVARYTYRAVPLGDNFLEREPSEIIEGTVKYMLDPESPDHSDNVSTKALALYQPSDLLKRRRDEDASTDLWTTLNVIQENVVKGGVGREDAIGYKHTTRPVNGLDQQVHLNKDVWMIGEAARLLKAPAAASAVSSATIAEPVIEEAAAEPEVTAEAVAAEEEDAAPVRKVKAATKRKKPAAAEVEAAEPELAAVV